MTNRDSEQSNEDNTRLSNALTTRLHTRQEELQIMLPLLQRFALGEASDKHKPLLLMFWLFDSTGYAVFMIPLWKERSHSPHTNDVTTILTKFDNQSLNNQIPDSNIRSNLIEARHAFAEIWKLLERYETTLHLCQNMPPGPQDGPLRRQRQRMCRQTRIEMLKRFHDLPRILGEALFYPWIGRPECHSLLDEATSLLFICDTENNITSDDSKPVSHYHLPTHLPIHCARFDWNTPSRTSPTAVMLMQRLPVVYLPSLTIIPPLLALREQEGTAPVPDLLLDATDTYMVNTILAEKGRLLGLQWSLEEHALAEFLELFKQELIAQQQPPPHQVKPEIESPNQVYRPIRQEFRVAEAYHKAICAFLMIPGYHNPYFGASLVLYGDALIPIQSHENSQSNR